MPRGPPTRPVAPHLASSSCSVLPWCFSRHRQALHPSLAQCATAAPGPGHAGDRRPSRADAVRFTSDARRSASARRLIPEPARWLRAMIRTWPTTRGVARAAGAGGGRDLFYRAARARPTPCRSCTCTGSRISGVLPDAHRAAAGAARGQHRARPARGTAAAAGATTPSTSPSWPRRCWPCSTRWRWTKVVLLGNSMGCPVSLEVAHAAPERVDRLVLVSPAGGIQNQPLGRALVQLARDGTRETPADGPGGRARLPALRAGQRAAAVPPADPVPVAGAAAARPGADAWPCWAAATR